MPEQGSVRGAWPSQPWLRTAADLLWPQACAGCRQPGSALCQRCQVIVDERPRCRRWLDVGTPIPVWSAGTYTGLLRTLILRYKERGDEGLRPPLARLLADCMVASASGVHGLLPGHAPSGLIIHVVGVPTSPGALRRRGGDPIAALIAAACGVSGVREADARGWPRGNPIAQWRLCRSVRAHRARGEQSGRTAEERRAAMVGALRVDSRRVRSGCADSVHVIADDVVTTGASAIATALALREAGAAVGAVACLADTPRLSTGHRQPGCASGRQAGAGVDSRYGRHRRPVDAAG